ncbi:asparagine synthase [Hazenella sp. IB182357]|uniref:asparagine synthase (glutamine-hydrolyzing) n=1 Tax=Polycladospora coralii TaxID=2771432 RepID=A0A926NHH0_9BACL|nr:asparagine synthase C-terminal domain-containing protein [Polycladospora coralii]MBD1373413.1 asparagine synthase [Polycladospora coralii]
MTIAYFLIRDNHLLSKKYTNIAVDDKLILTEGSKKVSIQNFILVIFEDDNSSINLLTKYIQDHNCFDQKILNTIKTPLSFLIYDCINNKLEVFRSLTANPVFYFFSYQKGLVISNKLENLSYIKSSLNDNYFRLYFNTELTETEHTPYNGIKRLMPAHKLTKFNNSDLTTHKFWSLPVESTYCNTNIEENIHVFSEILSTIVGDIVARHRDIGCEISGGLDSSSISCLLNKNRLKSSKIFGYSYIFDQTSGGKCNKDKVDQIYQSTGIIPTYIDLSKFWSFKDVKNNYYSMDEPSFLALNHSMYTYLRSVAYDHGNTVLVSGQGGDELFYGGTHYLRDLLFQREFMELFNELNEIATKKQQPFWKIFKMHVLPAILPVKIRNKIEARSNEQTWRNTGFHMNWYETADWVDGDMREITYLEVEEERLKIRDSSIDSVYLKEVFERFILINPCTWINNNICVDSSLRYVHPFRDQRLIEFMYTLPAENKLRMSQKKMCIREAMTGVVPNKVLTNPDKNTFTEVFRKGFSLEARLIDELIEDSRSVKLGWVKKDKIKESVDKFKYGFNNDFALLIKFFGLELWFRQNG